MLDRPVVPALIDVTAGFVTVGSIVALLPPLAALFSIVWYVVSIYESNTGKRVRRWIVSKWSS